MITITKRKMLIFLSIVAAIIIVAINIFLVQPIKIDNGNVHKIFIAVNLVSSQKDIHCSSTITEEKEIERVIEELEEIKAWRGDYSVEDIGERSPSAWVNFYDVEGNIVDQFQINYDILLYDSKFYLVSPSVHDKLKEICEKYGTYEE